MFIIIPLGGLGTRFRKQGYTKPKALINVFGKPILYYLLDNLQLNNIEYVCIPYNKEYGAYNFESTLRKNYPNINFKFMCLDNQTNGAAETIYITLKKLNIKDSPVLCLDGDNFYNCDIIKLWNGENVIFSFIDYSNSNIYSYIKCDKNSNIIEDIQEKKRISNIASTGAYGFKSSEQLLTYIKTILDKNIKQENEFYTSGIIKEMIKENIIFFCRQISKKNYFCIGTPLLLKQFYNNIPLVKCCNNENVIEKKRICFDLDNTLVSFPKVHGDYSTVEPLVKNIELLRYLKKFNNTIIIYTARRMKTHNGNIGKLNKDIGKITFDTLEKFNIPYDEIYFGKPHADFYIDDLAINSFDDIEKLIGFYNSKIECRSFNQIEFNSLNTVTKKGDNLTGEIYYYKNIPTQLKDLFPLLITYEEYDNNDNSKVKNSYTIEAIDGLTLSDIYTSGMLTENILKNVLNSIKRIHSCKIIDINDDNLNIYENYSKKIKERYKNFDYSKYVNSENIYNEIINQLEIYEKNKNGQLSCIHGDPVFTNILINNYSKIKFIDMRGKINNTLTIKGDIFYDWAKVYQSLIGYDSILLSKPINTNYQDKLINVFKDIFLTMYTIKDFQNIKLITKSLLFSLIPLHNNNKCYDYYNLINSKYLL